MELGEGDRVLRATSMRSKNRAASLATDQDALRLDVNFRSYMETIGKIVGDGTQLLDPAPDVRPSRDEDAAPPRATANTMDWSSVEAVSPRSDVSSARLSTVPDILSPEKDHRHRPFSSRCTVTEVELPFGLRNAPNGSLERNNVEKFLRRVDKLKAQLQSARDRSNLLQKDKSFLAGRNEYLEKANHDLRTQLATVNSRVASLEDGREKLLVDARKIHEKDRAHYLHSFQKVIRNMDSEKMQELNSTIRKQVRSYESQISDLRKQNDALADEKRIFRKESEDLRRKLDAAEVKVATGQSTLSQEFTKLQISMAARTHDYEENKHKLHTALEAVVQLKDHIAFLQDRNSIILKQYETLKEETDAEVTKLTRAVNEKDARLEAYERTSANITNLPTSDGSKQSAIDDLSDKLAEVRKELAEKTGLLHGANEKTEQLRAALQ